MQQRLEAAACIALTARKLVVSSLTLFVHWVFVTLATE